MDRIPAYREPARARGRGAAGLGATPAVFSEGKEEVYTGMNTELPATVPSRRQHGWDVFVLAIFASVICFAILIVLQVLELIHYKATPGP